MPILASMDVGTNTVRLLAAEVDSGVIVRRVLDLRANTRLGEGLRATGIISDEAAERTVRAVSEFMERLSTHYPDGVSVVGTEAIRRAGNAEWFISTVKERTGVEIETISGEEEARRMLMGVRAAVGDIAGDGPKLVVDIGGGSTELVATHDFTDCAAASVQVGAVTLYEEHIEHDPPLAGELDMLREHARELLAPEGGLLSGGRRLIGTAGTITTLAAVELGLKEYDPAVVTGHEITRGALETVLERLSATDSSGRLEMPGLESGREDVIVSGAVLLGVIMDISDSGSILVSDYGLREGNLLNLQDNI